MQVSKNAPSFTGIEYVGRQTEKQAQLIEKIIEPKISSYVTNVVTDLENKLGADLLVVANKDDTVSLKVRHESGFGEFFAHQKNGNELTTRLSTNFHDFIALKNINKKINRFVSSVENYIKNPNKAYIENQETKMSIKMQDRLAELETRLKNHEISEEDFADETIRLALEG